jgi:hypothetical protein
MRLRGAGMSRTASIVLVAAVVLLVAILVTVNVTRCETFTGPLGFLRFTACEEEPLINPPD